MRLGSRGLQLFTAATLARLADEGAGVAVVLVVLARTADPGLAGLVVAAFALPSFVTGPVLGACLDRLRAKKFLFLVGHLVLASALIGILVLAGRAPNAFVIGLGLLGGSTGPVLTGGFSSVVPLVVPSATLSRANAVDAASYNIAGLGGPAVVAAISGAVGAGVALSAIAAIATVGLLVVVAVPMSQDATGADRRRDQPERLAAALADGLRLLWRVPLLRSATAATTLGQVAQGMLPVTLPLFAVELGWSTGTGAWLLTAISGGALIGALAYETVLAHLSPRAILVMTMCSFALCLAALGLTSSIAVAVPLAGLAGVADGPLLAATLTVRQRCVPAHRYAQVVASGASLKTGAFALGAAGAGLFATALTPRQLLLVAAIGHVLACLPLLQPHLGSGGVEACSRTSPSR